MSLEQNEIKIKLLYSLFILFRVKKYRQDAVNGGLPVIFLNAGDTFTGTPLFQFYRDKIVNDFLNTLKPDAVVRK